TIDPYCRNSFGANYHPMFRSWEYYESDGDQGVAVPKDSEVFNLNAGTLFVPLIYACVSYINPDMTPPTLTASATTADGQPYTYNTWTNQDVTVQLTCADNPGGTGVEYPPDPATQTVSGASGLEYVTASCTDYASNATTKSFGPILVDQTKPVITPSAM